MPLVLTRRAPKVIPGNLGAGHTRPGHHWEPSLGSASCLISIWGKWDLEGRFSEQETGWWARGDLVVLSVEVKHLRTGWQWGNRIPEVFFSVPVWIQGPQVVECLHPRWRLVGRVVGEV